MKHKLPLILTATAGLLTIGTVNAEHHEIEKVATEEAVTTGTIVEIAMANPDFSTLVAAVKAADLVEALSGEGPFTVFAPNNAAFDKLPEGTVETLLLPENKDKLVEILTYHVVPAKVMAADVKTMKAPTLEGTEASVVVADSKVMIDNAEVIATDVAATNGVIHVVDTVIMPAK